jgi:fido (protein-threonine AMPylation protein)
MAERVEEWREVRPVSPLNGELETALASVDSLQAAWSESIAKASPKEFQQARLRTLRRHAIETGIIERIYDVDWGVTEALVAEGLTLEVAEGADGVLSPETLAIIHAQFDALEYLSELARGRRQLSLSIIRDLHKLITKHQKTYQAVDLLGNEVDAELHHGEWKKWPNHVRRPDGTLYKYAPPEQVEHQLQTLLELHRGAHGIHPLVRAAWFHHSFICVHPFEDGNGRVGRALLLLDLLRGDFAPLVVDRTSREGYIAALEAANHDDLSPLVRMFVELEKIALRSELHLPVEAPGSSGAAAVARAHTPRLRQRREVINQQRRLDGERLAGALHERMQKHLERLGEELKTAFHEADPEVWYSLDASSPPDPRSQWWRHQIVRAAKEVDFWANRAEGVWWIRLNLNLLGQSLRFLPAIVRVGDRDVGVMAVIVSAEMPHPSSETSDDSEPALPTPLIRLLSSDSVTVVAGQNPDDVWPEVEALLDRTAAAAVDAFARKLS